MYPLDHETVARLLAGNESRANVRGEGAARFVFAERAKRAVEISALEAAVWVEYWGNDQAEFDRTFADANLAVSDARTWLIGGAV
jgi:hypothetical protein